MAETRLPKKIQVARLAVVRKFPYLASALYALIPVESEKCPTMSVDYYWRLYYNPEMVENWSAEEVEGVLMHEIEHLLREHHDRARLKNAQPMVWNITADAEINDDLIDIGMTLPKGCIMPNLLKDKDTQQPMSNGELCETYYDQLEVEEAECSCGSGGSQNQPNDDEQSNETGDENGQGQDQSQSESGGDGSSDDGQSPSQNPGSSSGEGHGDQMCPIHGPQPNGSAASQQPGSWEKQQGEERAVNKTEGEMIRRDVAAEAIKEAEKNRGTVPGYMERWANEKMKPQVPWKQVLRGAVRRQLADAQGQTDYVRNRTNRRQDVYREFVLPSLRQPRPKVAIGIDTSGSMSEKELSAALAEVDGVLRKTGIRDILVFTVDHAVGSSQTVTNAKNIKLVGGGGTDMGLCITEAEKMRPNPDFLIVITDGYTPWPASGPKFKTIVCSTTQEEGPKWARTVHIDMDK